MFVRRKHNKSGTCSIQVVAKVDGKYRVQKSFGSSRDEAVLASLEQKAKQWANEHEFGEALFAPDGAAEYDAMMSGRCITGSSTESRPTSASASSPIQSCWSWSASSRPPDPRYRWIEHAFWRRRYTKSTMSILTTTSASRYFSTPRNSPRLLTFSTSSQQTAEMGVPLRKTGKKRHSMILHSSFFGKPKKNAYICGVPRDGVACVLSNHRI